MNKFSVFLFCCLGIVSCSSVNNGAKTVKLDDSNIQSNAIKEKNEEIFATGLTLSAKDLDMDTFVRTKKTITATVEPANYNQGITWTSSDNEIISISQSSDDRVCPIFTLGTKGGDVAITASVLTEEYKPDSLEHVTIDVSCLVHVKAVANKVQIEYQSSDINLSTGSSLLLSASVLPMGIADNSVTWVSEDSKIVQVNSNGLITAVGSTGRTRIYAYSNESPSVYDSRNIIINNQDGKYLLTLDKDGFSDTSATSFKLDETQAIHFSGFATRPERPATGYVVLPAKDGDKEYSMYIDQSSFLTGINRIRSFQVFYTGGTLNLELENPSSTSHRYSNYDSLPSGAKVYDFSMNKYFKLTNPSDTDVLIQKVIMEFGAGSYYSTFASEFTYPDEYTREIFNPRLVDNVYYIAAKTDGFNIKQYLNLSDVNFTKGKITYSLKVNGSNTSDLLPKGITLFAPKPQGSESISYGNDQLFTGVKTAKELSETGLGSGLEGYLTLYNRNLKDITKNGYAYVSGTNPCKSAPLVESNKAVQIETIVEDSPDAIYTDRSVSMYLNGYFKTQNTASVFESTTANRNQVGICLNQVGAEISDIKIISYDEAVTWDGTSSSQRLKGEGTPNNPYLINSPEDLEFMRKKINVDCEDSYRTAYYNLESDISLNGKYWKGIGYQETLTNKLFGFAGHFNGKGHTISGLRCDGTSYGKGLFNVLGSATITNLHINGLFYGGETYIGALAGIVGDNQDTLNCTINKVYCEGTVGSSYGSVGGIVGTIEKHFENDKVTIEYCNNRTTIYSKHDTPKNVYTGGIVGKVTPDVNKVGPIVTINKCNNYGVIANPNTDVGYLYTGGITSITYENTTITDCIQFVDINVSNPDARYVGGIVGYQISGEVKKCGCYNLANIVGKAAWDMNFDGNSSEGFGSIIGIKATGALGSSESFLCDLEGGAM